MRISDKMPFVQEVFAPNFWVIGDVHGMHSQFQTLLWKIHDYELARDGRPDYAIVSVGDICDRGEESYRTFRAFQELHSHGSLRGSHFYNVLGNHDEKLLRALSGNKVQPKHGLNITLEEIRRCASPAEIEDMILFLQTTPLTIKMVAPAVDGSTDPQVAVVVHAAFHNEFYMYGEASWGKGRTMEYSIYGPVRSVSPEGMPDRIAWENDYDGKYFVFYGHKIIGDTPKFSKRACGVDTGCFQSGILTAVSFPDRVTLQVTGKPSTIIVD